MFYLGPLGSRLRLLIDVGNCVTTDRVLLQVDRPGHQSGGSKVRTKSTAWMMRVPKNNMSHLNRACLNMHSPPTSKCDGPSRTLLPSTMRKPSNDKKNNYNNKYIYKQYIYTIYIYICLFKQQPQQQQHHRPDTSRHA